MIAQELRDLAGNGFGLSGRTMELVESARTPEEVVRAARAVHDDARARCRTVGRQSAGGYPVRREDYEYFRELALEASRAY